MKVLFILISEKPFDLFHFIFCWAKWNKVCGIDIWFLLLRCIGKQTGDENKQDHQLGDVVFENAALLFYI